MTRLRFWNGDHEPESVQWDDLLDVRMTGEGGGKPMEPKSLGRPDMTMMIPLSFLFKTGLNALGSYQDSAQVQSFVLVSF